jgi:hypothetical protein
MAGHADRGGGPRLFQDLVRRQAQVVGEYVALLAAALNATGSAKEKLVIEATIRLNIAKRFEDDLVVVYATCVSCGHELALDSTEARLLYAGAKGVGWEELPQADFEALCAWLVKEVSSDDTEGDQAAVWLLRAFEQARQRSLSGVVDALLRAR